MEELIRKEVLIRDEVFAKIYSSSLHRVIKAIKDYRMILKGDRIMVAVSGGKDSLSMMHFLDFLRKNKIFEFDMLVCNVELGYGCARRALLARHFEAYGIEYIFIEKNILGGLKREDIDCFWCSWNRRKILFQTAKDYNCNKICLGHHLDDIIHTALLNLFVHGEISTSPASLSFFGGEIVVIRPLSYLPEEKTREIAKRLNFPLSCCDCPNKASSKRTLIKQTFSPLFQSYPYIRENIFKALKFVKKNF